jgi:1-acyl-sn-glycerol-3-phosphate acyltransferase
MYSVPFRNRLGRAILRPPFRLLFHILSPVKMTGRRNVPKKGPYIIAINHVSLYDPPFIVAFWPVAPEAAGAAEIWTKPGQSVLARIYGGMKVHRGQVDRRLLESMLSALQSGYPLLIAPEGGRSHTPGMRRAEPGAAYLADKTGAPVIPVGIVGTTDDFADKAFHFKRPPLEIHIGQPLHLPPVEGKGNARHQSLQANADLLMRAIANLLPPEYHGVYARGVELEPLNE